MSRFVKAFVVCLLFATGVCCFADVADPDFVSSFGLDSDILLFSVVISSFVAMLASDLISGLLLKWKWWLMIIAVICHLIIGLVSLVAFNIWPFAGLSVILAVLGILAYRKKPADKKCCGLAAFLVFAAGSLAYLAFLIFVIWTM